MAAKPKYERAGQPTKYKKEYCAMLVDHMSQGFSFFTFAAVIEVNPDTIAEWCHVHKEFSEAKQRGLAASVKWWETVLQAGATGRIKDYNAASAIFALKNKAPAVWRDRQELITTVNVNLPMTAREVREVVSKDPFLIEDDTYE